MLPSITMHGREEAWKQRIGDSEGELYRLAEERVWCVVADRCEAMDTDTEQPTPTPEQSSTPSKLFQKLSPGKKFKLVKNLVNKLENVEYHKDCTVSIQISKTDSENLEGDRELEDFKVTIKKNFYKNRVRGQIYNNIINLSSQEEITEDLAQYGVFETSIKEKPKRDTEDKVVKGGDGKVMFVPSNNAVLSFERESLPKFVVLFGVNLPVYPYYPDPIQCKKCFDFGHTTKYCKSPVALCGWCSQLKHAEPGKKCEHQAKCKNCEQEHLQCDHGNFQRKKCAVYERQEKIAKVRETNKTTYWEAAQIVDGKRSGQTMAENVYANNPNTTPSVEVEKKIDQISRKLSVAHDSLAEQMQENMNEMAQKLNEDMTTRMNAIVNNMMTQMQTVMQDMISQQVCKKVFEVIPSTLPLRPQPWEASPNSDMAALANMSEHIFKPTTYTSNVQEYANKMMVDPAAAVNKVQPDQSRQGSPEAKRYKEASGRGKPPDKAQQGAPY